MIVGSDPNPSTTAYTRYGYSNPCDGLSANVACANSAANVSELNSASTVVPEERDAIAFSVIKAVINNSKHHLLTARLR